MSFNINLKLHCMITTLFMLGKLACLVYLIYLFFFVERNSVKYVKETYFITVGLFLITILQSIFGPVQIFGLIIWGILSYIHKREYDKLNDGYSGE